jgi:hypothetical protein
VAKGVENAVRANREADGKPREIFRDVGVHFPGSDEERMYCANIWNDDEICVGHVKKREKLG